MWDEDAEKLLIKILLHDISALIVVMVESRPFV